MSKYGPAGSVFVFFNACWPRIVRECQDARCNPLTILLTGYRLELFGRRFLDEIS